MPEMHSLIQVRRGICAYDALPHGLRDIFKHFGVDLEYNMVRFLTAMYESYGREEVIQYLETNSGVKYDPVERVRGKCNDYPR